MCYPGSILANSPGLIVPFYRWPQLLPTVTFYLAISSGFRQPPSPLPLQKRWHRFFMWLASEYHSFLMWLASEYHALLVVLNIFPHLCKEHLNYPTEFNIGLLLRYIKINGKTPLFCYRILTLS